ncbi:MAG: hypothetical protein JJU29_12890 [Verrucomicrobia bacterium]|nr:hypothetical protein [Verrucomicrobiota bacterium]MCH8512594.1 hypothetical protein [Kiritimatiellia bacterium]
MTLDVAYRGGVVVYLNGVEIVRGHLADGDEVQDIIAEPYGKEAWFADLDDEKPIIGGEAHQHADWLNEHRVRRLNHVELPAEHLRAGLNVVAILVNSTSEPLNHTGHFQGANWPRIRRGAHFMPMGLVAAELRASGEGFHAPTTTHPDGVRIWASSPLYDITPNSSPSQGDEDATLRLIGPRGGQASAPIVASSTRPIATPEVSVSDLTGEGGNIPASAVRVMFASRVHRDAIGADDGFESSTYSVLGTNPTPDSTHQPVWLVADIPADAAPGLYRGSVEVRAGGVSRTVPIELSVGAYALPDNRDFVTFVGMLHIPDNTARRYQLEMWSDAHFERLGQVFDLLAGVGNRALQLPLALGSFVGGQDSIVHWVEEDGQMRPDFTLLERYLRLYDERVGEPRVLGMYIWSVAQPADEQRNRVMQVTRRNADGSTEMITLPPVESDEGKVVWRPFFDGIRALVKDLGWHEDALLISSAHDAKPPEATVKALQELAPGVKWNLWSHSRGYRARESTFTLNGMEVGFHEEPWSPGRRQRDNGTIGGWDHYFPQSSAARFHFHTLGGDDDTSRPMVAYRNLATGNVAGAAGGGHGNRTFWGFSRFQFDYWPVPRQEDAGRYLRLLNARGYVNLMRNHEFLLAPGAEGPQPTVMYQQIREGLQETEARLILEIALSREDLRGQLGDELESRAVKVLRDNLGIYEASQAVWSAASSLPWRANIQDLYDTAGAVQQRLGVKSLHQHAPMHRR